MSLDELLELHARVTQASSPEEVFRSLLHEPSSDPARRIDALEQEYVRLTQLANPERHVGNPHAQNTARRILTHLYEQHQNALSVIERSAPDGSAAAAFQRVYNERSGDAAVPVMPVSPVRVSQDSEQNSEPESGHNSDSDREAVSFAIATPRGSYQADRLLAEGELSMVYGGSVGAGGSPDERVAIKVAHERNDNSLLLDEARTLRLFESTRAAQLKQLPRILDQFQTADGRAGLVLRHIEGHDLHAIHRRYPQGVDPRHAVWIFRRLLSVIGFAHSQGVIHGNIEPTHILVSAPDHNASLIDWSYAIVNPSRSGQGFKVHNPEYSAPEVAERKPPIPASDLYSLGKCMIFLLGGDLQRDTLPEAVDERFARFVQFFVRESPRQRAQDAWEMYEQVKALREEIYGPHQFLKFEM